MALPGKGADRAVNVGGGKRLEDYARVLPRDVAGLLSEPQNNKSEPLPELQKRRRESERHPQILKLLWRPLFQPCEERWEIF
jgi:hypothetical protein